MRLEIFVSWEIGELPEIQNDEGVKKCFDAYDTRIAPC